MTMTLEIPDVLVRRAEAAAAERKSTLRSLVIEGLEKTLEEQEHEFPELTDEEKKFWIIDEETGLPMLKKRGVVVTQEIVDKIMEEEGM